jgi:esterase/lipase superfamily enzyme
MKKKIKSWQSPSTGKKMQLMVVGDEGTPVIVFPSAHGKFDEWDEKGVFEDVLKDQVERGFNQFFCVESFSEDTFMNDFIDPISKLVRFNRYQEYLVDELLPYISELNPNPYIINTGVGIGAYCSLLMALKHPSLFNKVIGLSGYYDIRVHLEDEFADDTVYFNNPVEFIPNLNDQKILKLISDLDIRFLNFKNDPTLNDTRRMSDILWLKFIEHEHYVWDVETDDLWTTVPQMLKDNLF